MKTLTIAFLVINALIFSTSYAQDDSFPQPTAPEQPEFLQPGQWWNLYADKRNDALKRSTRAVKIVRFSKTHPSWVQICFPANRKDHVSIFGPVAKAHDDEKVAFDAEIAKWEKSITEWKHIWVNLDFVVSMSPVETTKAPQKPIAAE